MLSKKGIFPIKPTQGKGLKILAPIKMPQRLPEAVAKVKACSTFGKLLN